MNIHIGDSVTVDSAKFPSVAGKIGTVVDLVKAMNPTETGICVTFGAVTVYVSPLSVTVTFPRKG
jgi:fructose-specific component phosphotransferase system IIB-like protein